MGEYPSWEAAAADATGYDAAGILAKVAESTRQVVRGEAKFERDSVLFDRVAYAWPLLAGLLQVALERRSLRVLDFGGSLGSTYRQNAAFLARLSIPVSWRIVEQAGFTAVGRAEFSTSELSFHDTISAASIGGLDVALFASSLCYVEDPRRFLAEIESGDAPFLLIDRLPVIDGGRDRIALQRISEPIYDASYPVRIFGEEKLLNDWLAAWELIESWDCELQADASSHHRGYFLQRRKLLAKSGV